VVLKKRGVFMNNPQRVVEMFEENVAEYTGAKYAVSCDNCTNAIRMSCEYYEVKDVTIPARTYLSVPQSIIQAGGKVTFDDYDWAGIYQLYPYPIYDAAKRFTSNMYMSGTLMCLSFGIKKPLKIGKGGMILTDSKDAYEFLKKKRWSGRSENVSMDQDDIEFMGYNSYITPEWAARGMMLLGVYPEDAEDQIENPDYRDLRTFQSFK
jgi:dTDP-4-amino-4,6-dideoxygalactose transaminase